MTIDKILKVEDLTSLSTDMLIEAYKNGYKVEELPPHIHNNNDIETIDNYKNWKPLSETELQEIKKSVNLDLKLDIKTDVKLSTIRSLLTCPDTIIQGTPYQITAQALGGISPYTFEMFTDNYVPWKDASGNPWKYVTSSTNPISWYNTFSNPSGTHKIILKITDSSISPQTKEDVHTVNIVESLVPSSISTIST